jgi:glycine dehydrogenase subunit 1
MFVPHTEAERRAMLDRLGLTRLEELFADVPEGVRFPPLDLPAPISEPEVERELAALAGRNLDLTGRPCFLGAGAYRHYVPAVVEAVLARGELATSYTPYQPEVSQGMLQALFEYQSMICRLTRMEVCTASHYDGAAALAEGVLLALAAARGRRRKVVLSAGVDPRYRNVLDTYLRGADARTVVARSTPDRAPLLAELDQDTAACVVQSPSFFGQLEDVEEIAGATHRAGALLVVVPDLLSLGLLRAPGDLGADVVAAGGQCLGIPPSYGGPGLGVLATRAEHVRRLPGRLVGETVDREGRRGYVHTLGTREQHIRRAKATSNICTNSALMAVAAAVYLATLGRSGLRQVAKLCWDKSHYAAERIAARSGCAINPQDPARPFFEEFVVELPRPAAEVGVELLERYDIVGGFDLGAVDPELSCCMLIAVTELCTREDVDRLAGALADIVRPRAGAAGEPA